VRHELGTALAVVHRISGPRFGYSGDRPHGSTWSEAFGAIVDSLLSDAAQWDVALPGGIRAAVARHSDVLDRVQRPSLVHFDLWDGNVLATDDGRLTGLVDGERWLYADAAMDLVSPVLLRRIEDLPDHPLRRAWPGAAASAPSSPRNSPPSSRPRLCARASHASSGARGWRVHKVAGGCIKWLAGAQS
jgi:aminoglycoside phosphotransferase (APT) family kinase protein